MNDKARKLKSEYMKKWRKEHPEANKKNSNAYWVRKAKKEEVKNDKPKIEDIGSKEIETGNADK